MKFMRLFLIWGIFLVLFYFNSARSQQNLIKTLSFAFSQLPFESVKFERNLQNPDLFSATFAPSTRPVSVMTEDFDGEQIPKKYWEVFDQNKSGSRECYWGVYDNPKGGNATKSIWCAATRENFSSEDERYPQNFESWMVYGPIDLREVNWVLLKYSMWLDSQLDHDYLAFGVSTNNKSFTGFQISGCYPHWQEIIINLDDKNLWVENKSVIGEPKVWFAWVFKSDDKQDDSINEGAFLDSIEVQAAQLETFDIQKSFSVFAGIPTGITWDGSHVWLADAGTNKIYRLNKGWPEEVIPYSESAPTGLAWDGNSFWIADSVTNMIYQLSRNGEQQSPPIKTPGNNPFGITWQDKTLWHTDTKSDFIYNHQEEKWQQIFLSPGGKYAKPTGIAWNGIDFWLAEEATGIIYQIDENGNPYHYYLAPAPYPRDLAYDGECVWCVTNDSVFQLAPKISPLLSVKIENIHTKHISPEILSNTVWIKVENHGRNQLDLEKSNFKLTENSIFKEEFQFHAPKGAHYYALVLDRSCSMQDDEDRLTSMINAAKAFIDSIKVDDHAAIVQFAYGSKRLLNNFISNKNDLKKAIDRIVLEDTTKQSTYLYDGIQLALDSLITTLSPDQSKAIIVITDGKDSPFISGYSDILSPVERTELPTPQKIIRTANNLEVPIFICGLGKSIDKKVLDFIAKNTGGFFLQDLPIFFDSVKNKYQNSFQILYKTKSTSDKDIRDLTIQIEEKQHNLFGTGTIQYKVPAVKFRIPDDLSAPNSGKFELPVYIEDIGETPIYGLQMNISYLPKVFKFESAETSEELTSTWVLRYHARNSESVDISLAGIESILKPGKLLKLWFAISGQAKDTSYLKFNFIRLNESETNVRKWDGFFRVSKGYIVSGNISYYFNLLPIDSVRVTSTVDDNIINLTKSGSDGLYVSKYLPWASIKLKAEYTKEDRMAISPLDASLLYQYINNKFNFSPLQMIAGDVNKDCKLTIDDILLILDYCNNKPLSNPVVVGNWTFIPSDYMIDSTNWTAVPNCYSYRPLSENKKNQNFKGIIYGDVFEPLSTQLGKAPDSSPLLSYFSFNDLTFLAKNKARLKIHVQNMEAAQSFFLGFKYSAEAIKSIQMQVGEMLDDFMIRQNCESGMLRIAGAGLNSVKGSGEFLVLNIELTDAAESKLDNSLLLTEIQLDEKQVSLVQNLDLMGQQVELPTTFGLSPNYPNPFNLSTVIKYQIPEKSQVKIEVFNTLGQTIKVLVDKEIEAGYHQLTWNAEDEMGRVVPSGIYLYRMQAGSFKTIRKMTLFK